MQIRPYPQSSLYITTILFVIVVCSAMLGLNVWEIWAARELRMQQAKTDTANLAGSLAQHVQDIFQNADATLKGLRATISEDGTGPAAMASLARRMRMRVVNQETMQRLYVYDERGNWLASSLDAPAYTKVQRFNYIDRDYFKYHRDHIDDIALIGPPIQNKLDGIWIVTITRRLYHPDGGFAGVVGASVGLDLFQRFFETFDIGEQGAIALTSKQGMVIVRRPFDAANIGRTVGSNDMFRAIRDNADTGSFEFISLVDGTPRLGSFHRVSGFDLVMIVALARNEVLASWWHDTRVYLAWVAVIITIVAFSGYQITLQIRHRAEAEAQLAHSQQTLERRIVERTVDLQQMVNQRDFLLREVYHRVNNNMQVVNGLLAMEAAHLTDAEARQALADMRTRIYALGLAHQQFMASGYLKTFDVAPFLDELATKILAHSKAKGMNLTIEVIPLMVTLDFAIPLGLIVNELITDCLAYPFQAEGECATMRLQCNAAADVVLTIAANRAVPIVGDLDASSRRAKLLQGLIRQIDGTMTVCRAEGWHCKIVFANPGMLT